MVSVTSAAWLSTSAWQTSLAIFVAIFRISAPCHKGNGQQSQDGLPLASSFQVCPDANIDVQGEPTTSPSWGTERQGKGSRTEKTITFAFRPWFR
jgi:hypothetical protein